MAAASSAILVLESSGVERPFDDLRYRPPLWSTCSQSIKAWERTKMSTLTHRGGCHCGAVTFEIEAPAHLETHTCNCSICDRVRYQHLIVPQSKFRLLSGEDCLSRYTFGSHQAEHWFCQNCGIKSFYKPRSNPDGISVNARCLDPGTVASITDSPFDGQNWEKNARSLAHLSSETAE